MGKKSRLAFVLYLRFLLHSECQATLQTALQSSFLK